MSASSSEPGYCLEIDYKISPANTRSIEYFATRFEFAAPGWQLSELKANAEEVRLGFYLLLQELTEVRADSLGPKSRRRPPLVLDRIITSIPPTPMDSKAFNKEKEAFRKALPKIVDSWQKSSNYIDHYPYFPMKITLKEETIPAPKEPSLLERAASFLTETLDVSDSEAYWEQKVKEYATSSFDFLSRARILELKAADKDSPVA